MRGTIKRVLAEKGREGKGLAVGSGASVQRRLSTTLSGSLVALLEETIQLFAADAQEEERLVMHSPYLIFPHRVLSINPPTNVRGSSVGFTSATTGQ